MATKADFPGKLRFLFKPSRYKFIRGGRGSGKSWGVARALLIIGGQKPTRILCTREVQKSIKQSVHQLLTDQIKALCLESFYQVLQTEIRGANGTQIFFNGLSDLTVDSIKSFEGCDIVWIEEAQSITERSLKVLVPTIRRLGSEIWATYNPELETDPIHQMAVINPPPDTVSIEMNYGDNPWFPEVLEQERIHAQATMAPEEYAHVWEGRCKPAVDGAIYFNEVSQAEQAGRFARVPYDPLLKVHTIWDLGFNDSMTIIFAQRAASEIRVIDYIEDSHKALPEYVEMLRARGYNYGTDYLPHDGFATRHQTGKSDADVLQALGRSVERVEDKQGVEGGIRNARVVFPRIWFNAEAPGVKRLIECLKRYRRNVSAKTGEAGNPLHDEYSHGADAFRYLCLVADQLSNGAASKPATVRRPVSGGWMA